MRSLRFYLITLFTFILVTCGAFLKKAIALSLCTILGVESLSCNAIPPLNMENIIYNPQYPSFMTQDIFRNDQTSSSSEPLLFEYEYRPSSDYCGTDVVSEAMNRQGYDRTLYVSYFDFRRGQEGIDPTACGREYWISPDTNHPNYGIRFVYLVNGLGQRITETLYYESSDGGIQLFRNQIDARLPDPFASDLGLSTSASIFSICPSPMDSPRNYQIRKLDESTLESTSDLNEKLTLKIKSTNRLEIQYEDCNGNLWDFIAEDTESRASTNGLRFSSILNIFAGMERELIFKKEDFEIKEINKDSECEILSIKNLGIDPRCTFFPPLCQMMDSILLKLDAAMGFDGSLTGEIPNSIKITARLLRRDWSGTIRDSAWEALTSIPGKLFLEPLKDSLSNLRNRALDCSATLQGECAGNNYNEPLPQPEELESAPRGSGDCGENTFVLPQDESAVIRLCSNPRVEGFMTCFWNQSRFQSCVPYR